MKNAYHADIKSGVLCGPSYPSVTDHTDYANLQRDRRRDLHRGIQKMQGNTDSERGYMDACLKMLQICGTYEIQM
jgi:hypothetical protein